MAYFEDRTEDGPGTSSVKRAVGCALTMTAANEHLISPVLRVSGVEPLQFRASIEHGAVTIARIGAPQRFNANVAIGNAANFASKMLKHVGADQIGLGATAREKLPVEWQTRWTVQSPVSTGWVRSNTNDPYPIFLYTGRWVRLI
jgi:class 3 adenylate cyclase